MAGSIGRVRVALRRSSAAAVAVALAVMFAQLGGGAQTGDALPYSRGYLVTGNYVVAGVDLTEQQNPVDQNGLATGTIHVARCAPPQTTTDCVPDDADIVAAYLYWESIIPTATPSLAAGVKFRGEEILLNDIAGVKANSQPLTGTTASCWSSGSPLTMVQFRADVLRFLPIRLDKDNKPTGKRLVTDADLAAHNQPLHTVTLPMRNGNQIPESAGASLLLVYRDPAEPLRKIVVYDGIHIQPSLDAAMTQTLRGFYQSSASKSARVTHILGSGQPNGNERVSFSSGAGTQTISPADPVAGTSSSQRAWSTLTYDVSSLMTPVSAAALTGFGETVTTSVTHTPPSGGYDCLAWGAVIFSTAVKDVDHDGLPDGLEDAVSALQDPPTPAFPQGQPLPNLHAMGPNGLGASSTQPDLFIEFNAMRTTAAKTHGSSDARYPGVTTAPFTKSVPAHTHMPSPEVLRMIGDAYMAQGIRAHFDVGNIDAYKALGVVPHIDWVDDYTSSEADAYLIPSEHATGGEVVDERACDPSFASCQFPAYPGTVSWKVGLQLYRDAPVTNDGTELVDNAPPEGWNGRRRFDRNRKGLFHYVLYAHYRGRPKSLFPCLDNGTSPPTPIDYTSGTSCTGPQITENSEFHVPSSASGVADLPGGSAMVTLGFWDDFVGRPFIRASTTFHELGHNFNLWHGGPPAIWGNKALGTSSFIEPNCKPNYLSSMSYLFQAHGLYDDDDAIHLGFSSTTHDNLSETTLAVDGPLNPLPNPPYRPAWYAPVTSPLAITLGVSEAKRFCHGDAFGPGPTPGMARVYTLLSADAADWNGGDGTTANPGQDLNFDNSVNTTMLGFNDVDHIRLDQISAGRNAVKFQDGDFLDFGSGDFLDFGSGDFLDFGSGDFLDFGSGDFLDFGSGVIFDESSGDFLDFGSGDFLDFGSGDFLDFGSGDFLDFGSGSERQELDFELAKDLGRTQPYSMKGCVVTGSAAPDCVSAPEFDPLHHRPRLTWKAPSFGRVAVYEVSRKRGTATSTFPFVAPVPTSTTTTTVFVDEEQLPNDVFFTYRSRARYDDNVLSGFSKTVTLQAKNVPPVVNQNGMLDTYTVERNRTLTVNAAQGVLANDRDPDSPAASIFAVLVTPPASGTLTLNANGSFTYRPRNGFTGVVTFQYKANNGTWTADPNVPMNSTDSATANVVINVVAK